MTKIMAPILCYTCDEIWQAMPHRASDDARNVLFNDMNQPFSEYASGMMESWNTVTQARDGVNAALEAARAEKKIGKSLEAKVTLVKDADAKHPPRVFTDEQLADLFIVSAVDVKTDAALYETAAETPVAGVRVLVSEAEGEKCPRCWKHTLSPDAEGLCPRCARVVSFLN